MPDPSMPATFDTSTIAAVVAAVYSGVKVAERGIGKGIDMLKVRRARAEEQKRLSNGGTSERPVTLASLDAKLVEKSRRMENLERMLQELTSAYQSRIDRLEKRLDESHQRELEGRQKLGELLAETKASLNQANETSCDLAELIRNWREGK